MRADSPDDAKAVWRGEDWHGAAAPVLADWRKQADVLRRRVAALPPRRDGRPRTIGRGTRRRCAFDRERNASAFYGSQSVIDWLPEFALGFLHIPKCASSSIHALLEVTFGGYCKISGERLPPDAFVVAFLRDPVERFLSGYEESLFRAMRYGNESDTFERMRKRVPWITDRLGPYNHTGTDASSKFWDDKPFAEQTFDQFVRTPIYDSQMPMDVHSATQSALVATSADRVDFVGYVETINEVSPNNQTRPNAQT